MGVLIRRLDHGARLGRPLPACHPWEDAHEEDTGAQLSLQPRPARQAASIAASAAGSVSGRPRDAGGSEAAVLGVAAAAYPTPRAGDKGAGSWS
jgi:hypothetical protein